MRSLLFVPGNDSRKIEKALGCDADAIILDLEDSVAPGDKQAARTLTAQTLASAGQASGGPALFVRINALNSGFFEDDLDAILKTATGGIMQPKTEGAGDVTALGKALDGRAGGPTGTKTIPIIAIATETARSLFHMGGYETADNRLTGLAWGAEDLSADLGATTNKGPDGAHTEIFRLARTLCLAGAVAAGVTPIDTVYVNYRDADGLRRECEAAARDGFTAKLAIHPAQVPVINEVFTPTDADITRARRILDAFLAADNAGVVGLDGEMLDQPHRIRAEKLLARAALYSAA